MSGPLFLELDEVLSLHAESIARFGGGLGIRDVALLESAVAMPQATMFEELLHPTLHEQAAAYLFHLVKNHPFVDGNKRIGLAAALAFLGVNEVRVVARPQQLIDLTIGVAAEKLSKSEVATFFLRHGKPW